MPADNQEREGLTPQRNLLRGASLTLVGLVLTGLVRAVARIGAERWFGVEALGVVTVAMSVATIVTIVGAGGLSAGVTKFVSHLRGEGSQKGAFALSVFSARLGIGFSLLGMAIGAAYAALAGGFDGALEIAAVATLVFVFGVYLSGKSILYGEDRIRPYVTREAVGALLFAITLGVALVLDSPPVLILALSAAYAPVAVTSLRAFRRLEYTHRLPIRPLLGYGVLGVVGSLAGVGFSYSTPLAGSFVDALAGAALIGGILTVLEPFNLLPRAVSLVLLPDLSEKNARIGTARSGGSLRAATGLVAAASAPVLFLMVLERDRILGLIFKNLIGGPTLAWFALAFFIRIVGTPAVTALAAIDLRRASISMWSSLVGFATAIGVWILAAPEMGIAGVGLGYAVGTTLQVVAPILVATRRYALRWRTFWYRIGAVVGLGIAALFLRPGPLVDVVAVVAVLALTMPELRDLLAAVRARRAQQGVVGRPLT